MLGLILMLVVVWLVLVVLLWVGTLWFQGYIYSEPVEAITWRAPAAGSALALFFALWCILDYRSAPAGANELPYETIFHFAPEETYPAKPFPEFWSIKKGSQTPIHYTRKQVAVRDRGGMRAEYVNDLNRPWARQDDGIVEAILIEENGQKVRFNAKLVKDPNSDRMVFPDVAVFVEEGGRRTITEDELRVGQMSRFRYGLFFANVIINLLHLGIWFVCLWLLLRFQMWHALGLAVVFWLVMTFAVLPMLLGRTFLAVQTKAKPIAVQMVPRRIVVTARP